MQIFAVLKNVHNCLCDSVGDMTMQTFGCRDGNCWTGTRVSVIVAEPSVVLEASADSAERLAHAAASPLRQDDESASRSATGRCGSDEGFLQWASSSVMKSRSDAVNVLHQVERGGVTERHTVSRRRAVESFDSSTPTH